MRVPCGGDEDDNVTLHQDGDLSAAVTGARVVWPVTARHAPVEELIRRRMWWHQLTQSTVVVVRRNGMSPGSADVLDEELVWKDLDIAVRSTLDADLIGLEHVS
jgi:hypothetical protein